MATVSPALTSHLDTVASVTDSPNAGTLISTAMTTSSANGQRAVNEIRLLLHVRARRAGGRRRRLRPADIDRSLGLHVDGTERLVDAAIDELPGAHVLGLLLAPH